MTISLYQASVPVFVRALTNLSAILKKAEEYAETRKIDPSVLLNSRLAPDMFSLTRQVQIACDAAKNFSARVGGVDIPSFPDVEKTFAELQERIVKTIAFVQTIKPVQIDGKEESKYSFKVGPWDLNFTGQEYLLTFALPNLFFHITTTYAILRHNGLDIGKADYLGNT